MAAHVAALPSLRRCRASCALAAAAGASAQFRRGILAESTEIMLFPAMPPALLLPAGKFQVDVKNQSTGPARLLSRLDDAITTQIEENDSPAASRRRQAGDDRSSRRSPNGRWRGAGGTRYVSETRQMGTKQVTDTKGNKKHRADLRVRPQQADGDRRGRGYRASRGAARHAGAGRRDGAIHLSATIAWSKKAHAQRRKWKMTMLDRAAQRAAGLVTPGARAGAGAAGAQRRSGQAERPGARPKVERVARGAAGNAAASRSQDAMRIACTTSASRTRRWPTKRPPTTRRND